MSNLIFVTEDCFILANSADPDEMTEMPHCLASHLGLEYLI